MELRDYLRVLRRGWVWVVVGVLLGAGAAMVFVSTTTPLYSSTTRLFVTTPVADAEVSGAYTGTLFTQQRVRSYADLVESDLLAERVIEAEDLDEDPVDLASQVSSSVVPDTVLLDITVTDSSAQDAQTLATAYADEFAALVSEIEKPPSGGDPLVSASVVNTARVADAPVAPQPVRTVTLGAVLGLLAGIGGVVLRDVLDNTITGVDQLTQISGAPNLGVVAFDPDARDRPLIVQLAPRSPRAEAFRQLRTNLQFVDVDAARKVITVTSSVPEEGKTTTAVNLAIALADAGVRVLLLEGDLRRPKVADHLGLVEGAGLTDLLVGTATVDDVTQNYGRSGLHVIASGRTPPNPSELLQSKAMDGLLRDLATRADVVIIDSPPLLPVTDAAILATRSDGAILITRHGKTTTDQIHQAITNLTQVGGQLLGTVLTMTPTKGPEAHHYGYSYGYGPSNPVDDTGSAEAGNARTAPVGT